MPHSANDYEQIGVLIDGAEFIPQDIWLKHLPVALPPGSTVQAVYVKADEDG